nr:uncharacterized protein LOC123769757 isoform X1 [Procambarus clarkii]
MHTACKEGRLPASELMESKRSSDAIMEDPVTAVVKDMEEHVDTQHVSTQCLENIIAEEETTKKECAVIPNKSKTKVEEQSLGKFDIKLLIQKDTRKDGLQDTLESIKTFTKEVGELPTTATCRSIIEFELPLDVPWWNNKDDICLKQKIRDIANYQTKFKTVSSRISRIEFKSLKEAVYRTLEDMETSFITHTNKEEDIGTKDNVLTREVINNICNLHVSPKERLETINLHNAVNHMKEVKKKGLQEDPLTLGLLDFDQCIINVHKILMKDLLPPNKCGVPSTNKRCADFEGFYHEYPKFDTVKDGEAAIQRVLDRYNDVINWIKFEDDKVVQMERLFKCAAWLLLELVGVHPFADGNGRLCRLLCSYAMSVVTPFSSPIYNIYSDTRKHDYVRAIIADRKVGSPFHLTALIIESNWCAWNNFFSQISKDEQVLDERKSVKV